MREILKFKRKDGQFKIYSPTESWQTCEGIHYLHYPFLIHRHPLYPSQWCVSHMASGTRACKTSNLRVAKYLASRFIIIPQFFLPHKDLVSHMTMDQRGYCTDLIRRYSNVTSKRLEELDKNCPITIWLLFQS